MQQCRRQCSLGWSEHRNRHRNWTSRGLAIWSNAKYCLQRVSCGPYCTANASLVHGNRGVRATWCVQTGCKPNVRGRPGARQTRLIGLLTGRPQLYQSPQQAQLVAAWKALRLKGAALRMRPHPARPLARLLVPGRHPWRCTLCWSCLLLHPLSSSSHQQVLLTTAMLACRQDLRASYCNWPAKFEGGVLASCTTLCAFGVLSA